MRANRGGTDGRSTDQGQGSGAMREPSGGSSESESAEKLGSRTDRGNQNDEDVGSSASRSGGGGEANAPRRGKADIEPVPDTDLNDALGG
jgi:hypothetical protein